MESRFQAGQRLGSARGGAEAHLDLVPRFALHAGGDEEHGIVVRRERDITIRAEIPGLQRIRPIVQGGPGHPYSFTEGRPPGRKRRDAAQRQGNPGSGVQAGLDSVIRQVGGLPLGAHREDRRHADHRQEHRHPQDQEVGASPSSMCSDPHLASPLRSVRNRYPEQVRTATSVATGVPLCDTVTVITLMPMSVAMACLRFASFTLMTVTCRAHPS